ncbi:hypothetical protein [Leminorella grimontii]|uniref:hypothetical protein n=1 Tax=Leminorella grimontii TaxID=82981 RepID=UPI002083B424|nr:hypothetical protein [Leminorella grimontii]GKX61027.1 hypothetical protein SOASR031_33420 [Leminorella grimontii]
MLIKGKTVRTAFLMAIVVSGLYGCTNGIPNYAFRSRYEIKEIEQKDVANAEIQGRLALSYKNLPGEELQIDSLRLTQKFVNGGNTAIYAFPVTLTNGETIIKIPVYNDYTLESISITFNYRKIKDNSINSAQADIYIKNDSSCQKPGCTDITWWNKDKFHNNEKIIFQKGLIAKANFKRKDTFFIRASSVGVITK